MTGLVQASSYTCANVNKSHIQTNSTRRIPYLYHHKSTFGFRTRTEKGENEDTQHTETEVHAIVIATHRV